MRREALETTELDLNFCLLFTIERLAVARLATPVLALVGDIDIVLPGDSFLFVVDLILSLSLAFLSARLFFSFAKHRNKQGQ